MLFINKTKNEIKEILGEKSFPNTDRTIQRMEEFAREQGSTTGNLEDYSFSLQIEDTEKGSIIKKVNLI